MKSDDDLINPDLLAPYQCKDQNTANQLQYQGIGFNDDHISVKPSIVELTIGASTLRIPMYLFERFARWYLEPQERKKEW